MTSTDRLIAIHDDNTLPTRAQTAISALITPLVTAAVNNVVNGAPGALDTLKELADAIGDDANYAATITAALGTKVNSSTYTSGLAGKVDTSTYTSGLAAKADASALTAGLAAKPDLDATGHLSSAVMRQAAQQQHALRRTGALAETYPRIMGGAAISGSDQLGRIVVNAIYLLKGTVVSSISFGSSNLAGAGLTHTWFSLWDSALNKLAVTSDDVSATWPVNTEKTLTLTSPYTVTADGLFYVGYTTAGTTAPRMGGLGFPTSGFCFSNPVICGQTAALGLTDPSTAPASLSLSAGPAASIWAYVS